MSASHGFQIIRRLIGETLIRPFLRCAAGRSVRCGKQLRGESLDPPLYAPFSL